MKMNLNLKNFFILFLLLALSGCTVDDEKKNENSARHDLNPGASANDFLSDERYNSVHIEIVYVNDYEPTETTLGVLKQFFEVYTHKPGGVRITPRAIPPPNLGTYSVTELRQVEKENRSIFTTGDELGVYVFFADEVNENNEEGKVTLGKAYYNTSIAIYDQQIQNMTGSSAARTKYQHTVLRHEFGHLFGLVNNGSAAQSAHEDSDPGSKAHCNVEGCLMSAYLNFDGTSSILGTSEDFVDFDEKCQIDLKANGGK